MVRVMEMCVKWKTVALGSQTIFYNRGHGAVVKIAFHKLYVNTGDSVEPGPGLTQL